MCYNVRFLTQRQLKYAKKFGDSDEQVKKLEDQLKLFEQRIGKMYHSNGFDHPDVPVITNLDPGNFQLMNWGLIPRDTKVSELVQKQNKLLNARSETIFKVPDYRSSAITKRCVVVLDGFYEYHHKKTGRYNSIPYHITLRNEEPMAVAGIWDHWEHEEMVRNTFTILTTRVPESHLMAQIHNNPDMLKRGWGHRMPVILPDELIDHWLDPDPAEDPLQQKLLMELLKDYEGDFLRAHTVGRLNGKEYIGNQPKIVEEHLYTEDDQKSLF